MLWVTSWYKYNDYDTFGFSTRSGCLNECSRLKSGLSTNRNPLFKVMLTYVIIHFNQSQSQLFLALTIIVRSFLKSPREFAIQFMCRYLIIHLDTLCRFNVNFSSISYNLLQKLFGNIIFLRQKNCNEFTMSDIIDVIFVIYMLHFRDLIQSRERKRKIRIQNYQVLNNE